MKGPFNPSCDRHGHLLTGLGVSPQVMAPFTFPTAEEIALFPGGQSGRDSMPHPRRSGSRSKKKRVPFQIRKILVPVDSQHTKSVDLKRVTQLAQRLDAQLVLLYCYETPRSFSYARGDLALDDVIEHQETARAHLKTLCSRMRRSWSKCVWLFEIASFPAGILDVSKRIHADLIVVPRPLDPASDIWSTSEVLDQLVRKAGCPVLAASAVTAALSPKRIPRLKSRKRMNMQ